MRKNMGNIDRGLRILAVGIIGVLYLANLLSGTLAVILGIVAVVFLATSFIGSCPLYGLLKVSTGIPRSGKKDGVVQ